MLKETILLGSATVNESEVIIELGAEGGSITLSGFRTDRGWSFWREVTDWTPELIDEERIHHESAVVDSWEAALKLLGSFLTDTLGVGSPRFAFILSLSRKYGLPCKGDCTSPPVFYNES
jgi:hypothetical protein